MRKLAGVVGLLIATSALLGTPEAKAQSPYDVTVETVTWFPLLLGTTHQPTSYAFGYPEWDEGAASIALPFDFRWFGRSYRAVWVYSNGLLSFEAPPSGPGQDILRPPLAVPDPRNVPHAFIAPMWRNLTSAGDPEIRSLVEGSAPNRTLVVQVSGLRPEPGTPNQRVAFQVRLEEANGAVRVTYHPTDVFSPSSTAAIEDASGTLGANLLAPSASCTGSCPCVPGSCNSNNYAVPNGSGDQARSVVIRPPLGPELIGSIDGPDGAYPGTNFNAVVLVANVGLGAAGASTAQIRLSTDAIIDTSDTLLRTLAIGPLAAGATSSQTVSLVMPSPLPVARFFLGVIVDATGAVTESVETNNAGHDPGGLVTGPDLHATLAGPLSSGPGEVVALDLGLFSRGAPVSSPVGVTFYLSTDAVYDAQDVPFHSANFTLPGGFALAQQVTGTIPANTPPGTYRLLARVDPMNQHAEIDETNNVAVAPGSLTLTLPDVTPSSIESAALAFRGQPFPVDVRIANNGGTSARGFNVCLVLSTDAQIALPGDRLLVKSAALSLSGNETGTVHLEPMIAVATASGAYELGLIADCDATVSEAREDNNVVTRAGGIVVRDPAPDLLPVALNAPANGAAGEPLTVALTLGNHGNAPGAARIRLVLSENPGVTASDRSIYEAAMPAPLDPAEEQRLALEGMPPLDLRSGSYYVGAIVDPDATLDEIDDANNTLAIGPIPIAGNGLAIVGPPPPSAVLGVAYTWRFFVVGGAEPHTWTLEWGGARAPPGLSFDAARAELSGTPSQSAEGSYPLHLSVTSGSLATSEDYVLLVTPPTLPLSVVSAKLPPALKGEPYSTQIVAVGGTPPYEWTLTGGSLPGGLAMSAQGTVGGEALSAGASIFEVTVRDATNTRATASIAIDVIDPRASLSIATADLPSAMVDEAYRFTFTAAGGTAPYTWRVEGRVPPGLSFDLRSGELSGTPTIAGSYPMLVEVRDQPGLLDRNAYVLRVFELGELEILTGRSKDHALPQALLGRPYQTESGPVRLLAEAAGGGTLEGLRWSILDGSLPDGLVLDSATGVISGTPATEGVFPFSVLAYDLAGDRDRVTLAIEVVPEGVVQPPSDGCGCGTTSRDRSAPAPVGLLAITLAMLVGRRRRP